MLFFFNQKGLFFHVREYIVKGVKIARKRDIPLTHILFIMMKGTEKDIVTIGHEIKRKSYSFWDEISSYDS